MTQIFAPDGATVAATLVRIPRAVVTQVRSKDKDGYTAVQVGTNMIEDEKAAERKIAKPQRGHLKAAGASARRVYEFRVDEKELEAKKDEWQVGKDLSWASIAPGDLVRVSGTSKGKGFAGVVKRHHFAGGPASHGHKDNLRLPGSIGSGHPQHVIPGTRMAGHMGDARATVKNLEVLQVNAEQGVVVLKGAVPGAVRGWLEIEPTGTKASYPTHERVALGAKAGDKGDAKSAKESK